MRRALRTNAAVAIVTAALVVANAVYWTDRDHAKTVSEHEVMAHDLAFVVADQVARSIGDTDLALRQIADLVRDGGGLEVFRDAKEWAALHRIAERVPGGVGVLLADPRGTVVASSLSFGPPPLSVAERDYLKVLAERDVLYIGAAVNSKVEEDEVVYTVNRRLTDGRGKYVGVASAGLRTSYLTDFYGLLGFEKDPGIVVFRAEGDILARRPNVKEFVGRSIADKPLFQVKLKQEREGVFRARSPLDGIDRINAYRTVGNTGLVVLVGIPWDVVTADWTARAWRTGGLALVTISVILLAGLWGAMSLRGAIRAQREREAAVAAKERAKRALHSALRDHLTGLPARGLFLEQIERLRGQCRRGSDRMAVMVVDLDGFKAVNDTYGHDKGDEVLVQAAAILGAALRDTDVAGRIGGDEFGICIAAPDGCIEVRARLIAARIVERMGAIGLGIGCSLGVAICPATDEDIATALRKADEAMYRAKRSGKNRFAIWDGVEAQAVQDGAPTLPAEPLAP